MTVTLRGETVGGVLDLADACAFLRDQDVDPVELARLALGEEPHALTLLDEVRAIAAANPPPTVRDVAARVATALGSSEVKDALRSRPERFNDGPWLYQTEPEFPRVGSPDRDHVRIATSRRIAFWEREIQGVLERFYERQMNVVIARLRGKQGRKGTRHWNYRDKSLPEGELKAIDPKRVLDKQRWRAEIETDGRQVMTRAFARAAEVTSEALGERTPPGVLDSPNVQAAIRDKIRYLMSSTDARADQVMKVILDMDASEADLDAIVEAVKGTYDQRSVWARAPAHVLAASTVNEGSLAAAMGLGVAFKQWLSSRDEKVRFSHRSAGGGDGQIVPIAAPFIIGGFPLQFPGDPSGLPATGPHVYGCRCSLLFARPARDDPPRFRPLQDFPGAPPPAFTRLTGEQARSSFVPRYKPDAVDHLLNAWLGFPPGIDLTPAFRERRWRPALVRVLRGLAAAWLTAQALDAVTDLASLAPQITTALADAGVPDEVVRRVADRLDAEMEAEANAP